jgi:hypothetical protein
MKTFYGFFVFSEFAIIKIVLQSSWEIKAVEEKGLVGDLL